MNTLKIDKLSNRVTIISIIIPCLIGAIIVFAYLDMKVRVVDVDLTKQTQVERIEQRLDEKLNTLDIKIAKNRFDLDKQLPELQNQAKTMEGQLAKVAANQVTKKNLKSGLGSLEKKIAANAGQSKSLNQTIEKLNKQIASLGKKNDQLFKKSTKQIKDEINLFKEELDARLLELSNYEQQIGELRKSVSLVDLKYRGLMKEGLTKSDLDHQIREIKTLINNLDDKLIREISRLDIEIYSLKNPGSASKQKDKTQDPVSPSGAPSSASDGIKEKSITQ